MKEHKELFLYRIDGEQPQTKESPVGDPLVFGVLANFKKALIHERLYVSSVNPLYEGKIPTANVEIYPLGSLEEAAYLHREGTVVFIPQSERKHFEDTLKSPTPLYLDRKKHPEDKHFAGTEALDTKDVLFYDAQAAKNVDDILESVRGRVLSFLGIDDEENTFTLEDGWNEQRIDEDILKEIDTVEISVDLHEVSSPDDFVEKKDFIPLKEKAQKRRKERMKKFFSLEWLKNFGRKKN